MKQNTLSILVYFHVRPTADPECDSARSVVSYPMTIGEMGSTDVTTKTSVLSCKFILRSGTSEVSDALTHTITGLVEHAS